MTSNTHPLLPQSKFSSHGAIYPFTTERLDQYLPRCIRQDHPVFTVCGSGDQILNAIFLGVRSVSAFDINSRALWWSELKIAAARRLEYDEFRSFFIPKDDAVGITELFDPRVYARVRIALSLPARRFFDQSFLSKNSQASATVLSLLNTRRYSKEYAEMANLYLQDGQSFKRLKKALVQSSVRYLHLDVRSACDSLCATNATVLLSNLADYPATFGATSKGSFSKFLSSIVVPILRSKGSKVRVVAAYFYEIESDPKSNYHSEVDNPVIRKSESSRFVENFWEISFPGMGNSTTDGVLVCDSGVKIKGRISSM